MLVSLEIIIVFVLLMQNVITQVSEKETLKGNITEKPSLEKETLKGNITEKPSLEKETLKGNITEKPSLEEETPKEKIPKKKSIEEILYDLSLIPMDIRIKPIVDYLPSSKMLVYCTPNDIERCKPGKCRTYSGNQFFHQNRYNGVTCECPKDYFELIKPHDTIPYTYISNCVQNPCQFCDVKNTLSCNKLSINNTCVCYPGYDSRTNCSTELDACKYNYENQLESGNDACVISKGNKCHPFLTFKRVSGFDMSYDSEWVFMNLKKEDMIRVLPSYYCNCYNGTRLKNFNKINANKFDNCHAEVKDFCQYNVCLGDSLQKERDFHVSEKARCMSDEQKCICPEGFKGEHCLDINAEFSDSVEEILPCNIDCQDFFKTKKTRLPIYTPGMKYTRYKCNRRDYKEFCNGTIGKWELCPIDKFCDTRDLAQDKIAQILVEETKNIIYKNETLSNLCESSFSTTILNVTTSILAGLGLLIGLCLAPKIWKSKRRY